MKVTMAGYYLNTIDNEVFSQLTTSPTKEQGLVLADKLLKCYDGLERSEMWPEDREEPADLIVKRLALPDWYSDLSYNDANVWDEVVRSLQYEPGEKLGIDFRCPESDYESIYWDCTEAAAEAGATMMAEPTFGSSGFRYFGKPTSEYSNYPMYSLFSPDQTRRLLAELEHVEPHFRSLPGGEGSPREQFFECLLPTVREAVADGRVLWVQTDT